MWPWIKSGYLWCSTVLRQKMGTDHPQPGCLDEIINRSDYQDPSDPEDGLIKVSDTWCFNNHNYIFPSRESLVHPLIKCLVYHAFDCYQ